LFEKTFLARFRKRMSGFAGALERNERRKGKCNSEGYCKAIVSFIPEPIQPLVSSLMFVTLIVVG